MYCTVYCARTNDEMLVGCGSKHFRCEQLLQSIKALCDDEVLIKNPPLHPETFIFLFNLQK